MFDTRHSQCFQYYFQNLILTNLINLPTGNKDHNETDVLFPFILTDFNETLSEISLSEIKYILKFSKFLMFYIRNATIISIAKREHDLF